MGIFAFYRIKLKKQMIFCKKSGVVSVKKPNTPTQASNHYHRVYFALSEPLSSCQIHELRYFVDSSKTLNIFDSGSDCPK